MTRRLALPWRVVLLSVAMAVGGWTAAPAHAQDTVTTLPSPLTPEAINALVSRLSDREVRDLLLQELGTRASEAETGAAEPEPALIDEITQSLSIAAGQIVEGVGAAPDNAAAMLDALGDYFGSLGTPGSLQFFAVLALALGAGLAANRMYTRWMVRRTPSGALMPSETLAFPDSIVFLSRRLLFAASGAILALLVTVLVLGALLGEREGRVGVAIAVWLVFVPWFAWIVLRFFLSPHRPDLRLMVTDDRTARILVGNLLGLTIAVGLIECVLRVMQEIGADTEAQHVGFWINAIIFVWLAAILFFCRDGLRRIVRGRNEALTPAETWAVFAYPVYGLFVIALTWFAGAISTAIGKEEVVRQGHHFLSLGILLIAPMCDTLIRATVRHLLPPMQGSGPVAVEAYELAWRSYIRIARVIVFGAIILILAALWDIPLFGGASEPFSGLLFEGLLILAAGYVALEITSLLINRKLANERPDAGTHALHEGHDIPGGGSSASRLGTVLPAVNWVLQAAIVVVTVLAALSHVGVNVTALVAGAGVIGIAVGFGAQKLVADVVSGLFFLIDDAFRLNEYIDAGGVQGTVEKIALRSMFLRQSDGTIHCVPYSNISSVSNFVRDWGMMKQVFTVPFDTDTEKVRKIFKKIGQDLYEDPEFRDAFIQPFKYKGVSQVNDVGIVLSGKFMFKPEKAKHFLIKREIYRRVQADFAAAGIHFARREVRVSVDTDGAPVNEATIQSISRAAAASEVAADQKQAP